MDLRRIEHIVVLMYENRSHDHMLGYLPYPGRLTGSECNRVDPENFASEEVFVSDRAAYRTAMDPHHDVLAVNTQLFGSLATTTDPAPMSGFVQAGTEAAGGNIKSGKTVMDCYSPARLPALSALAQEFCLCDRWFASVPGPTWPNRFFVHAATSDGVATNAVLHPYEMPSIYDSLEARGLDWGVYYGDFPHTIALRRLWSRREHFKEFEHFADDVARGVLPHYSFIEPRYFDLLAWKANDYHPPHDVRHGEHLLADVYATLRGSALWEKSLLIVLFDEHGGFFDRMSPPQPVPNPDGKRSGVPEFDFDRLGLRVPAILVSPYTERGMVDLIVYEHASVPAMVKKVFELPAFLTERDAAANTFESALARDTPRTDAPLKLPAPRGPGRASEQRMLLHTPVPVEEAQRSLTPAAAEAVPLSEFQETLLTLADTLETGAAPRVLEAGRPAPTEEEAAVRVRSQIGSFLNG